MPAEEAERGLFMLLDGGRRQSEASRPPLSGAPLPVRPPQCLWWCCGWGSCGEAVPESGQENVRENNSQFTVVGLKQTAEALGA